MEEHNIEQSITPLVNIIDKNEDLITYYYKGKQDQILLSKELVDKLCHIIKKTTKEKEESKALLKLAIREAFELRKSDIVLGKNGQFFIKLFDETKKKSSSQERRYDGINEDDLKSFYDEFFLEKDNKRIFPIVAQELFSIFFIEKKINNAKYEKNIFPYIQTIIYKHLISKYDNSDGFFNGFAGYIFRIHFKNVFEYIADLILDEVADSNSYMLDFLNYYSLNILVINSKRYKIPAMETSDGLRWNTASILSISKKFIKTQKSKQILIEDIEELEVKISKLHINGVSPLQHQTEINKKLQQFDLELKMTTNELHIYLDSLALAKTTKEKSNLEYRIIDLKNSIKDLGRQKKEISAKTIDENLLIKYNEQKKILDSKTRQLKGEETIINKNKNLYFSMRDSLIKVLTSKKKLM